MADADDEIIFTLRVRNSGFDTAHAARLEALIDSASDHVAFDASKHVLAIAGIKPVAEPQVSVNIDVRAGYVIDLSEYVEQPKDMKVIGPK